MNHKFFLGIDISKDSFDFALINEKESIIFQSKLLMDQSGFKALNDLIQKYPKDELVICLESTGIYHLNILNFLLENGYPVSIVNPLLIHGFLKSMTLRKTKNDQKDAYGIALFANRNKASLKLSDTNAFDSLKPLIRERESLSKDIAKIKTEIKSCLNMLFPELPRQLNVFTKSILNLLLKAPSAKIIRMKRAKTIDKLMSQTKGNKVSITAQQIKDLAEKSIGIRNTGVEAVLMSKIKKLLFYQAELESLETVIDDQISLISSLKEDINTLKTINGIGDITAKSFLVEIVSINNFDNNKQLTAFIGTDPAIKQSGTSVNVQGKITKRGSSHLRRTIYQMAMGVTRSNPIFKAYLQKKRSEGKKYKQAMICVANKLIRTIFSMLKNKTEFDPNILSSAN